MLTAVGKERALKMLYGDISDEINKFKVGSGDDPISEATEDLESPIEVEGEELLPISSHSYASGTKTMSATCLISTTDYVGDVGEFGIFSEDGIMIYGETFSPYYKDGNTNLKIIGRDRHL